MKKTLLVGGIIAMGCGTSCNKKTTPDDPMSETEIRHAEKDTTLFQYTELPSWETMQPEKWVGTFGELIGKHDAEIKRITDNNQPATFGNTIEALERSGKELDYAERMLNCLYFANTDATIDGAAEVILPRIAEHRQAIWNNKSLWERVKAVKARKDTLDEEQTTLLDYYYRQFVRHGAELSDDDKARLTEIEKQISFLEVQFSKNHAEALNSRKLIVSDSTRLGGLPKAFVEHARAEDGTYVFGIHQGEYNTFMTYADDRNLRAELHQAYTHRAEGKNEIIVSEILNLRQEKARLLGYDHYADYVTAEKMSRCSENAYALLDDLWVQVRAKTLKEDETLQKIERETDENFTLEAWDRAYLTQKLREREIGMTEEELKPYFSLENVRNGAFATAERLYGIGITKMEYAKGYHEDVDVWEVKDRDSTTLGILYTDYIRRENKKSGAWMDELIREYEEDGIAHRPVVINVANFEPAHGDEPVLLTLDEVETLFHEFGHALHALFTTCRYATLSGTNGSPSDFVEMPSQLMEKWAFEPENLRAYARDYRDGTPIGEDAIDAIGKYQSIGKWTEMAELLAASYIDLGIHTLTDEVQPAMLHGIEEKILDGIKKPENIDARYRTVHFNHAFAFGYEAGYYSYTWAKVLSEGIYELYKRSGNRYNPEIAQKYREEILEKGASRAPEVSYKRVRAQMPPAEILTRVSKTK